MHKVAQFIAYARHPFQHFNSCKSFSHYGNVFQSVCLPCYRIAVRTFLQQSVIPVNYQLITGVPRWQSRIPPLFRIGDLALWEPSPSHPSISVDQGTCCLLYVSLSLLSILCVLYMCILCCLIFLGFPLQHFSFSTLILLVGSFDL